MIRRVSFGIALALAALTTVACSSPTDPTAKVTRVRADLSVDSTSAFQRTGLQGAGI